MTQALASKRFRIFKSSAGSGKTFTLVRSYLAIVLKQPEAYRSILAITFTNKAMGEMKERIVKDVFDIACGKDTAMRKEITQELGLSIQQVQANAERVLAFILHDYANFSVQTIDSFMYKLLRNFARDLDLPSRFDVELDTKGLLNRMMDQLMDTIGQDNYVTEILIQFTEEKLREENGWQIEEDVVEVAGQIFREESKGPLERLNTMDSTNMKAFIANMRERKMEYPKEIVARAKTILSMVKGSGLQPEAFNGAGGSFVAKLAGLDEKTSPTDFKALLEGRKIDEALNEEKWYTKSSKDKARIDELLDRGLREQVQELRMYHDEQYAVFLTTCHAFANIHSLAVLRQVEGLLEAYKTQNNLLHISDFQRKVGDFIRTEPPDYIYWRLGEKFRHYLFDEFQDTSVLQWHNLFPLFDYVRTADDRNGSLLLVGDAKQAIYRWRGGDSDLLDVLAPNQFAIDAEVLGTNYRSLEYVVDFNNRFFQRAKEVLLANNLVDRTYSDFQQGIKPGNEGSGLVQVHFFDKVNLEEYRELAMERCLTEIQKLLATGYQQQDIAILVRKADEGSRMARHLDAAGLRVISSDSLLLHKEPVVNFMVSLFRFLHDPLDGISRAEILHYYFHYLHAESELDVDRDIRIRDILADEHKVQAMYEVLPEEFRKLRYKLDQLPLYELAEETLRIFQLNDIAPAYLQQFLDVLLEYSERKKPDLSGFLGWWDEKKGSFAISMPKGQDAIEIMTIHKSKGLQFPVVFIPFATWDMHPMTFSTFWAKAEGDFDAELDTYLVSPVKALGDTFFAEDYHDEIKRSILDNLNLLYVAFTRPEERLYVYTMEDLPKSPTPTLMDFNKVPRLLTFVMDIDDFLRADDHTYETGMAPAPRKRKPAANAKDAPMLISNPWRDRIRIERKFRKYWEGQDLASGNEGQATPGISDGTLMADVLRDMVSSEELPFKIDRKVEEGLLDHVRKNRLEAQLGKMLEVSPLSDWFEEGKPPRRQLEILSPQGRLEAPDRLLMQDGHATIIEFGDVQRPSSLDRKKLLKYAEGLKAMGTKTCDIFILWLPTGAVERV